MGNCTIKGNTVGCSPQESAIVAPCPAGGMIRVATGAGEVLEFEAPVEVGDVLTDLPRYGIFQRGDAVNLMLNGERRYRGRQYYLPPPGGTRSEKFTFEPSLSRLEVLPPATKGVWRVRFAIDAEELAALLAEEVDVEALIERMRMLVGAAVASPMHSGRKKPAEPFSNRRHGLRC